MKPWMRPLLGLLAAACAWTCGLGERSAGGTSDTDNAVTVTGVIRMPDGSPAANARIRLRRDAYLTPFAALSKRARSGFDTVTDSLGRFRIDSVDTGEYSIEAASPDSGAGALIRASVKPSREALALPARTLEPIATVTGSILFRAGTYRVYVQAYGMERLSPADPLTGRFSMKLPAGGYTLRFVDPEKARGFAKQRDIAVAAGQELELDSVVLGDTADPYFAWRHSTEIEINTGAGGPRPIASSMAGFPLLVRLDTGNFDFSQALPAGADLRFSKPDGRTPLPYEIERWDAAAGRAEIWVRMDSVLGGGRYQSLYMYWGKQDAADASRSAAVFDSADGFAAVWHLGEAGTAPGAFRDAGPHGNHGTGGNLGDTSRVAGMIGMGQAFNGRDQSIRVADAASLKLGRGDFTLSAWVRTDALAGKQQILSKRTEPGGNYEFQLASTGKVMAYPGDSEAGVAGFQGKRSLAAQAWSFVVFTRQGGTYRIYLDGELDAENADVINNVDNVGDLTLGADATFPGEYLKGRLDEVRVCNRAVPADEVRFGFRNQVPGSATLIWRQLP